MPMTTTHLHITTWVITIILFLITYSLLKKKSPKAKMMHMVTRLFFIFVFLTGGMLISSFALYAVKMFVGILILCLMEVILVLKTKDKSTGIWWGLFIIAFLYVLYLGFSLPLGFTFLK